jgi:hypothetical protein
MIIEIEIRPSAGAAAPVADPLQVCEIKLQTELEARDFQGALCVERFRNPEAQNKQKQGFAHEQPRCRSTSRVGRAIRIP